MKQIAQDKIPALIEAAVDAAVKMYEGRLMMLAHVYDAAGEDRIAHAIYVTAAHAKADVVGLKHVLKDQLS